MRYTQYGQSRFAMNPLGGGSLKERQAATGLASSLTP